MKVPALLLTTAIFLIASCTGNDNGYDASGTFESVEIMVSAENPGILKEFDISEGRVLKAGQRIGYIDSTQLYLKKKQTVSQIKAVLSRRPDKRSQLASLQEQLGQAEHEQQRVTALLKAEAATQKQRDDADAQVAIIKKQIAALSATLEITASSLEEETQPLMAQLEQINDQISRCLLVSPVNGTVITKYAEVNEMVTVGKPLYKIADLSTLLLRAYITGDQFAVVKLGQKVKVMTDDGNNGYRVYDGVVEWISDKAEFTPKTIQTKDERANLVYATRIRTVNDGFLKIGMYGEVKF